MAEDKDPSTPTKVTFSEDIPVSGGSTTRRVELTMKYDRNSVQRRLDIEKWIETEMKLLYDCPVSCFAVVVMLFPLFM